MLLSKEISIEVRGEKFSHAVGTTNSRVGLEMRERADLINSFAHGERIVID